MALKHVGILVFYVVLGSIVGSDNYAPPLWSMHICTKYKVRDNSDLQLHVLWLQAVRGSLSSLPCATSNSSIAVLVICALESSR